MELFSTKIMSVILSSILQLQHYFGRDELLFSAWFMTNLADWALMYKGGFNLQMLLLGKAG